MEAPRLFTPGKIGNVEVKNRIIRSATFTRTATKDGRVTDPLLNLYTELARGGSGLIVTGVVTIDQAGPAGQGALAYYDDTYIADHKKLVDAVHASSPGVKFAAQIGHSGRQSTYPKLESVAPSAIPEKTSGRVPRALKLDEIKAIIEKFVRAGRRAYESGYDAVQLHAAHGYLLSSFLSPYMNTRTDDYGGRLENRARILVDIIKGLQNETGNAFPIMIKLQSQDGVPAGLTLDEGVKIAKHVADAGYDAIEPSGGFSETLTSINGWGIPSKPVLKPEEENYFLPAVKAIKSIAPDRAVILMGGVRNPVSVDRILGDGSADFVAMSRPLICEPDLPNRWKGGDLSPAWCKSCNTCYKSLMEGPLECVVRLKRERKRLRLEKKQ
jgi:2,4-dienoyl-CoA reductase-like NADH-dependent reductase (Old Yellow Enzyme family)